MKETLNFIKRLWQNKRTRSIAILILYFIFFLFVFSFISPSNQNVNNTSNDDTNNNTINNDTTDTDSDDEFDYLNYIEIISHNAYDNTNNLVEEYNEALVNPNVIYILVKNSVLESTNYINNTCIFIEELIIMLNYKK